MSTATRSTGYRLGYARVSTTQQDEALQLDALQAAGCDRMFVDRASGKMESRPALDDLLDRARPGDTIVVWRLDRLGRSLRHLIDVVGELERREITFCQPRRADRHLHAHRAADVPRVRRTRPV